MPFGSSQTNSNCQNMLAENTQAHNMSVAYMSADSRQAHNMLAGSRRVDSSNDVDGVALRLLKFQTPEIPVPLRPE